MCFLDQSWTSTVHITRNDEEFMDILEKRITEYLQESLNCLSTLQSDKESHRVFADQARAIAQAIKSGRKVMIAGNGGSAADAQHIAGEFISRLFYDRAPLPAIALTTDTSVMTAVANDYGYEHVFERQIRGLGVRGDVFLGISTSGKSPNILRALQAAQVDGIVTIGFTGNTPGPMAAFCDHIFCAPSSKTAIIQQAHIVAAHLICGLVEADCCPIDPEDDQ